MEGESLEAELGRRKKRQDTMSDFSEFPGENIDKDGNDEPYRMMALWI